MLGPLYQRITTAAQQADYHQSVSVIYSRQAFIIGARSWCPHRQSADYGQPRCRSTPVMSVPATSTASDQVITDLGSSINTGACIHQHQT